VTRVSLRKLLMVIRYNKSWFPEQLASDWRMLSRGSSCRTAINDSTDCQKMHALCRARDSLQAVPFVVECHAQFGRFTRDLRNNDFMPRRS
jgi:hypothetical protein